MTADFNPTREFAQRVREWPADSVALTDRCRSLVIDGIAVAAGGASEPGPSFVAELAHDDNPSGPASVIGHGFSTSMTSAARINGMSMHVLDFEPMWSPPNHALSPLLPALLALAEQQETTSGEPRGQAMLRALAKGVEAQGRLRLSSRQLEAAQLSLHPPGIVGPLATALACADLLNLDIDKTTAAIGIAASRTGGLLANIGSQTKALHCGDAAAHGLEAALLASRGFTANPDALNGPRGWGHAFFGDAFDIGPLLASIDTGRALEPGPSWKLFPSQFATHFGITAALDARAQIGAFDATHVERMELHVPSMPYIERSTPETGLDGKFSWQYTAVIALLDGKVEPASFSNERRFSDDAVRLLARTQLRPDADIAGAFDRMHVSITVNLSDGRVISARCDAPLGSWRRPVDSAALEAKARGLLSGVHDTARVDQIMDAVTQPPPLLRIKPLLALLR
jgi:aconitate decarboxylase